MSETSECPGQPPPPRPGWGALLTVFLLAVTALHFAFIATTDLDLFPDEAQYWDWSRRLDWSYYSKPPLVAYTIRASCEALGANTPLAVRFPAVLLGSLTTAALWLFVRELSGSARAALVAALIYRMAPLYVSEAVTMTTDSLLLLFWVLFALALSRATLKGDRLGWPLAGIAMALGLLSKYTMLAGFLWAGGAAWGAGRAGRLAGHGRSIAAGLLLSGIAFVPPLVWNVQHGWASFRHVWGNAGKPGHLGASGFATAGEFLLAQLGVLAPVTAFAIAWALWRAAKAWRREGDEAGLFLLWGSIPLLGFYFATSFAGRSEANWAAPAYVAGLAALARYGPTGWPGLSRTALLAAIPFTLLAYRFDLVYDLGLVLKPRTDPTTRMRGWAELGQAVGKQIAKRTAAAEGAILPIPFVLADSYQFTAELAFYTPGQPRVTCADLGRRRCQYDYWEGFDGLRGRDALYATEGDVPRPHHLLRRAFERTERLATVVHEHRGRPIRHFSLFWLSGYKGLERPDYDDW